MQNKLDILDKIEIEYNDKKLLDKSDINKYILNSQSFKIKLISTLDNKTIIVNDEILKWFKNKNINIKKLTYDEYIKYDFIKNNYVLISDLLKDVKGSIITYIEILDNSKKHEKEKELIELINLYGVKAIISSSEKNVIKYFKKKAPNIIRGIKFNSLDNDDLKLGHFEKKAIKNIKIPFGTKPYFIEYDINTLNTQTLDIAKKKNLFIISNLIDTDAKYKKAISLSSSYVVKCNYSDREEF